MRQTDLAVVRLFDRIRTPRHAIESRCLDEGPGLRNRSSTERVRLIAAAAGGGLLVVGIGSFSDRAPRLIASVERRLHLPWHIGEPALHVLGWLAITLLVTLALRGAWARRNAAVGIALLSVVIEILQPMFSSDRSFQLGDIAANVIGVAAGLALGLSIARAAHRREPSEAPKNAVAGRASTRT